VAGGPSPGDYLRDATLPEPADFQIDQYTRTPFDTRTYDRNGNVLSMESAGRIRVSNPDWADLSSSVSDASRGMNVHYFYDALGRRIGTALRLEGFIPNPPLFVRAYRGPGPERATLLHTRSCRMGRPVA
jgi:hypothetical protein